jgi:hypothetical protein
MPIKPIVQLIALSGAVLAGACDPGETPRARDTEEVAFKQSMLTTDQSGRITTQIAVCSTAGSDSVRALGCEVGADYVLVGGGGFVMDGGGAGAMLTASYPFGGSALSIWEARSKDHGVVNYHRLVTYAIGLKLAGLTRQQLRANITLVSATSGVMAHPQLTVQGPAGEIALGGGARVNYNGAGSMLTRSMPRSPCNAATCSEWIVGAKDHIYSDPATITGYVITIKENVPGFGRLIAQTGATAANFVDTGRTKTSYRVPDGWALTGLGADSLTASGPGRLLTRIGTEIDERELWFEDKDHLYPSAGGVSGYIQLLTAAP